ncbi:MAG: molybdenum cofactor guanylyltransferase [Clostridium sp.]
MEICALVLAGGKSTRMNGNNKAFLKYKDRTFIENILEVLKGFKKVYISVDDKEKYKNLNYELIEDEYKEIGPIGGIYSALKVIKEDYIFITACDMPKISVELIDILKYNLDTGDKCIVFEDEKGRIYPLGGIYSKDCLPYVEEMINNKNYRLTYLVKKLNGKIISLNNAGLSEDALRNINNPEEYNELNQ